MERNRCTYCGQDKLVPLDRMRRRIFLDNILISQSQKYEAEECRTHVGRITCLQPSLRPERLDVISEDLGIPTNDPWVGPYDCLCCSKQRLSETVGRDNYALWDEVTIDLDSG